MSEEIGGAGPTPRDPYKRVFAALFELTKAVDAGGSLDPRLKGVADALADLVSADRCLILLFERNDSHEEPVVLASTRGGPLDGTRPPPPFVAGEGAEGWVASTGVALRISDLSTERRWKSVGVDAPDGSLLCVPLLGKEGVRGTLTVSSLQPKRFSDEDEQMLLYLGGAVARDLENARLYRLSITDGLTHAYNRQYLYQRLPEELERFRRYGDPLSVILFDVDRFKMFNDTFGHPAGDHVLKEIVHTAWATFRETDGLVRYGGEEFLLLLPKTPLDGATEAAERLRSAVERAAYRWNERELKVTISLGVATLDLRTCSEEALIQQADDLLYRAKSGGRNRLCAAHA